MIGLTSVVFNNSKAAVKPAGPAPMMTAVFCFELEDASPCKANSYGVSDWATEQLTGLFILGKYARVLIKLRVAGDL
jgi:hypothetical protein